MAGRLPRLGRPLWVLLGGVLFSHLGYYLVLPYLAVILTTRRGLSPAQAGLVLAAGSLALQAGSLAGGLLADRLGQRGTMALGLALRGAGLGLLGVFGSVGPLLAAAALSGLGIGLWAPAAKAGIATLAPGPGRTTAFGLRGIAANVGTSVGPAVGAALLGWRPESIFVAALAVNWALALFTWLALGREGAPPRAATPAAAAGVAAMLGDRPFLVFSLLTVLVWALYAQLTLALPLRASDILKDQRAIGLLWTVLSGLVIALQVPVARHVIARLHPLVAMALGTLLVGAGLGAVAFAAGFAGLVLAVVVFGLGEMLLLPTIDGLVSRLARPQALGSYFGVAAFAWGLGEGLGNLAGGALMQWSRQQHLPVLPWAVFATAGATLAGLFLAARAWPALGAARTHPAADGAPAAGALALGPPPGEGEG